MRVPSELEFGELTEESSILTPSFRCLTEQITELEQMIKGEAETNPLYAAADDDAEIQLS